MNGNPKTETARTTQPGAATSMKDIARALALHGFPVFPVHGIRPDGSCSCGKGNCSRPGKHPANADGWKGATKDPSVIERMYWKNRNVGISTEDLLVLDVDGDVGQKTLAELEKKYGALPITLRVRTGGGGMHYYFQRPEGVEIKNAVCFAPKLDVRVRGGYVVGPGSLHVSGGLYHFDGDPNAPIVPPPVWLVKEITKVRSLRPDDDAADSTDAAAPAAEVGDLVTFFANAKLSRAVSTIKNAQAGERNSILNTQSYVVGQHVGAGQLDRGTAKKALVAAGKAVGLPAAEAKSTAESGLAAGEKQPRDLILDEFELTDIGNSERLVEASGNDIRFSPTLGDLIWDKQRWVLSSGERFLRLAIEMAKDLLERAQAFEAIRGRRVAKKFMAHATKSQSRSRIEAAIALARGNPRIWATEDFDADPYLLNCKNGTLDLRTGALREHRRDDCLTKVVGVAYDPNAKHKLWDKFLLEIFDGNLAIIGYVKRIVGLFLTGAVSEHAMFFAYGVGRNGKSTLTNILLSLLGEYASRGSKFLIIERRNASSDNDALLFGELRGKRLVLVSESSEGTRIEESSFKEATGGDALRGRILYHDPFTFRPTHKLWLSTNTRPLIKGGDLATARRLHLIPFTFVVPEEKVDPKLPEKLLGELPGILAWAVEGSLEWQKVGLSPPDEIRETTRMYLKEHDAVAEVVRINFEKDPNGRVERGLFYRRYKECMEALGEGVMSARRLFEMMRSRGYQQIKSHGTFFFCGIREPDAYVGRHRPPQQDDDDDD